MPRLIENIVPIHEMNEKESLSLCNHPLVLRGLFGARHPS